MQGCLQCRDQLDFAIWALLLEIVDSRRPSIVFKSNTEGMEENVSGRVFGDIWPTGWVAFEGFFEGRGILRLGLGLRCVCVSNIKQPRSYRTSELKLDVQVQVGFGIYHAIEELERSGSRYEGSSLALQLTESVDFQRLKVAGK